MNFYLVLVLLVIGLEEPAPPGTILIEGHYIDQTEILNIHWVEFMHYKEMEMDSSELSTISPDSANFWYSLPQNRYRPVTMITYEQALDYCKWRSDAVSESLGKNIRYRLPSPEEWAEIARFIWEKDQKVISRELKKIRKSARKDPEEYLVITRRERKGTVHDLFSNVSEMTSEKGIAMGSNNYDLENPPRDLTRLIKYYKPNTYLGFRCIAEYE